VKRSFRTRSISSSLSIHRGDRVRFEGEEFLVESGHYGNKGNYDNPLVVILSTSMDPLKIRKASAAKSLTLISPFYPIHETIQKLKRLNLNSYITGCQTINHLSKQKHGSIQITISPFPSDKVSSVKEPEKTSTLVMSTKEIPDIRKQAPDVKSPEAQNIKTTNAMDSNIPQDPRSEFSKALWPYFDKMSWKGSSPEWLAGNKLRDELIEKEGYPGITELPQPSFNIKKINLAEPRVAD